MSGLGEVIRGFTELARLAQVINRGFSDGVFNVVTAFIAVSLELLRDLIERVLFHQVRFVGALSHCFHPLCCLRGDYTLRITEKALNG